MANNEGNKKITLNKFCESFEDKINETKEDLKKHWYSKTEKGTKNNPFTNYIFNKVIYKILEDGSCGKKYQRYKKGDRGVKDCCYQPEYYLIDCPGWSRVDDKIKEKNFNYYCWSLDFSIEHENNCHDWMDEVIKLLYINCPLRIIIAYNDRSEGNDDKFQLDLVKESIQKIIDEINRKLILQGDEFGVILGEGHSTKEAKEKIPNYRYYKFYMNSEKVEYEEIKIKG